MPRDGVPQHQINGLIQQLAGGATLEQVQETNPSISPKWFEVNGESLLKLAKKPAAKKPEQPAAGTQKK
jgi:hypothetical protein